MWPDPAAAVISGHDADLKTGSTLSAHSYTVLKGERERERVRAREMGKMMTEIQKEWRSSCFSVRAA